MTGALVLDPALALMLHAGAALLWLSVSFHKLRDLGAFERALEGHALLPRAAVATLARALPCLELLVGLGCLVPRTSSFALLAGAMLLTLYTGAVVLNLARGRRRVDCGCGGPGGPQELSEGLALRNLALVGVLLVAALPVSGRALHWIDAFTVAAGVGWLALIYAGVDVALATAARDRREGGPAWSRR
jgi:hypothetical protein